MSRWIDADAWWKAVQKHYTDGDCADDDRYELGINVGITKSRNVMMSAPSIDIVRCGECKWFNENYGSCHAYHWDLNQGLEYAEVDADDFCSYGCREGE